jgi:hypothetical protein
MTETVVEVKVDVSVTVGAKYETMVVGLAFSYPDIIVAVYICVGEAANTSSLPVVGFTAIVGDAEFPFNRSRREESHEP